MSVGSRNTGTVPAPVGSIEFVVENLGILLTICPNFALWLAGPERGEALRQKAESAIGESQVDSVLIAFLFAVMKNMVAPGTGIDVHTQLIRLVLDAAGFVGSVLAICAYRVSSARAIHSAFLGAAVASAAWAVSIALRNLSIALLVILALVAVVLGAKAARKVSSTNIAAYRLDFIKEGLVFVSGNLAMSAVIYKFGYPQDYASDMELAGLFTTATIFIVCWGLASVLKIAAAPLSPKSGAMSLKASFMTYDAAQNLASYSIAAWCFRMTEFGQVTSVEHGVSVFGEMFLCCLNAVAIHFLAEIGFYAFEERVRQPPDVEQQAEKAAEGA